MNHLLQNIISITITSSSTITKQRFLPLPVPIQTSFPRNPFSLSPRIWSSKSSNRAQMETAENSHSVIFPEAVVGNLESLEKKKAAIRLDGPSKLQVIADFDSTLTKYWINGLRGNSSHGLLKQRNPVYDIKRKELLDYYQPLEFSPTVPIEEKTRLMEEWFEL